jgi:hypothetical protein
MKLTSNLDWMSTLNIAAVCVSFTFICGIVGGVI